MNTVKTLFTVDETQDSFKVYTVDDSMCLAIYNDKKKVIKFIHSYFSRVYGARVEKDFELPELSRILSNIEESYNLDGSLPYQDDTNFIQRHVNNRTIFFLEVPEVNMRIELGYYSWSNKTITFERDRWISIDLVKVMLNIAMENTKTVIDNTPEVI